MSETHQQVLVDKKAKSAAQGWLPPSLAEDRIVGTAEAATYCNFSVSHFRTLVKAGRAPAPIRLSERKLGWRISTLKAWVDQHHHAVAGGAAA